VLFWPGVDPWPPSKAVWIAAAIFTFVVTPAGILIGTVGHIILGAIVVICLAVGARARLKRLNAKAFWRSRPDD
jgi:hypothetical protein